MHRGSRLLRRGRGQRIRTLSQAFAVVLQCNRNGGRRDQHGNNDADRKRACGDPEPAQRHSTQGCPSCAVSIHCDRDIRTHPVQGCRNLVRPRRARIVSVSLLSPELLSSPLLASHSGSESNSMVSSPLDSPAPNLLEFLPAAPRAEAPVDRYRLPWGFPVVLGRLPPSNLGVL